MARSRGLKAAHRGSLRSILDRALPRVRDQDADDLDRASAYGLAWSAGPLPVGAAGHGQ
jgi:hypothetical protein